MKNDPGCQEVVADRGRDSEPCENSNHLDSLSLFSLIFSFLPHLIYGSDNKYTLRLTPGIVRMQGALDEQELYSVIC